MIRYNTYRKRFASGEKAYLPMVRYLGKLSRRLFTSREFFFSKAKLIFSRKGKK